MVKSQIFKELKRRYNMLIKQGYEVAYICLQGSQNYNMDMYTDKYKSDIDCMAVILPSLESIINNTSPVSTTLVLDNNEHINLKDIRLMFDLYKKQNQQFLETLFTDYKIINPKYKSLILELFNKNESIASINKYKLYSCISGMSLEKQNALEHPYPSIKDKIDKYGYDGKQLHHIIRLNQFIKNLLNGMSFKQSLTYFENEYRDMCIKAKLNEFSLEEARNLANVYCQDTYNRKNLYKEQNLEFINLDTIKFLDDLKTKILKIYFTNILIDDTQLANTEPINLDKYRNIFITSDLHFGHTNILNFEDRCNILGIPNNIEEHDTELIEIWNNTVNKNDLVFILGDFSFHKVDKTMEILKKLNGDKILIEGNHDCIYLQNKKFDKSLYKEIVSYKEIKYNNVNICLMHYPIMCFKHQDKQDNPYIHLFGHIHSKEMLIPIHSYNVGIDVNNYKILRLDEAIEKALQNTKGIINKKSK